MVWQGGTPSSSTSRSAVQQDSKTSTDRSCGRDTSLSGDKSSLSQRDKTDVNVKTKYREKTSKSTAKCKDKSSQQVGAEETADKQPRREASLTRSTSRQSVSRGGQFYVIFASLIRSQSYIFRCISCSRWRIQGERLCWSDREFLDNFCAVFVCFVSQLNRKICVPRLMRLTNCVKMHPKLSFWGQK